MTSKKLFISYRSADAAKVDKIARDLSLLRDNDGAAHFTPWQDKHSLPPASPHWWDAIVEAIIACDIFVFHVSLGSLQSDVCQAELDYAHKRNRPIIPVVLVDEYFLNATSGKYDMDKAHWDLVPEWMTTIQMLWYTGADFYGQFQTAVEMLEHHPVRDIPAPHPPDPSAKGERLTNFAVYDRACEYAGRLALVDAEKLFDTLVRRNDSDFAAVAAEWMHLLRLYTELIDIDARPNARFLFKSKWDAYKALFPKAFIDGIFDPKNFQEKYDSQVTSPSSAAAKSLARPRSIDLLPAPFAWINIPAGKYRVGQASKSIDSFEIAKYPLTNAQFKLFIDAGGYQEKRWWSEEGWKLRTEGLYEEKENSWIASEQPWTSPLFWEEELWNGVAQPVVGVSFYEATAFCRWLSETTGEETMLPTSHQWLYAALSDDGRVYPWGNEWDRNRCNDNVANTGPGKTSSVRQYEGKGDSPFGVVDMIGNVCEWCRIDYEISGDDVSDYMQKARVVGGSWRDRSPGLFASSFTMGYTLQTRNFWLGFRIVRSGK